MKRWFGVFAGFVFALGGVITSPSASVGLTPAADTFINSAAANSNAGGLDWFDAGTDGGNLGSLGVRRGLLRFDLGAIPANATITSAELRLRITKVPGFGQGVDSTMSLYRMNARWTEGTKVGPNGAPATAGETTWNQREQGSSQWTSPGAAADAEAAESASAPVGQALNSTHTWSGPGMVNDVQFWLANPGQNFGWLMRSQNETSLRTVRGFGSREAGAAGAPVLIVNYTAAAGTNQPPTVAISSPASQSTFTNGAPITITAEAGDADGSVTNVSFFAGEELLGSADAAPYSISAELFPGNYILTAQAVDDHGATTISEGVSITVSSQAIQNPIAERIPKSSVIVELQTVADGIASPLGMAVPNDGSGRMFVYDQDGRVYVLGQDGTRLPTPLLDLNSRLVLLGAYDERGLLGFALHPDFAQNQLVYTYTSEPVDGAADFQTGVTNNHQSVITEWRVSGTDSNMVDVATRREVLRIDQPQSNHNGGAMHFGPDGFLYIALGDGGAANDVAAGHVPGGNAQDINRIWGKLIRIDVAGTNSVNGAYGIPQDNPFVGQEGLDEIYAYGLRNPFSFSFDKDTGDLYMPDVGQNRIEEINIITKGGNYGWNVREGNFWFDPSAGAVVTAPVRPPPTNMIDPIAVYDHDDGLAVIGGYVYRGTNIPALAGTYVFGDWGSFSTPSGRLYFLDETNGVQELRIGIEDRPLGLWLKGFGQGPDGELYLFTTRWLGPSGNTGRMLKIVPAPAPPMLTDITRANGTDLNVSWSGGGAPFALQKKTSLDDASWNNSMVVLDRTANVVADSPAGFFRVADAAHVPPIPLTVYMTGAAEHPTNSSTGSGMGIFALAGNSLSFNIHYGGLSGAAMAGHIHGPVNTTTNAGVMIDLAPFNGGGWNTNGTVSGVLVLTDTQKAHLLAGRTYVNIHTPDFPGGEIRGQIAPANLQVAMNAAQENANVISSATGLGNLTLVGNQLTFDLTYRDLTGAATAAHFHGPATASQNAPPIIDLEPFNGGAYGASGNISGTATLTPQQLAWFIDGLIYVNVHTPNYGPGEIRGQVIPQVTGVPLTTLMSGLAERPTALTNNATGSGTFSLEGDRLSFNIGYAGLSGVAVGAHIHGPVNTTDSTGVMIDLEPFNGGSFGTAGTLSGSVPVTAEQRNAILNGLTYVNVHTPSNPGGELRGQIAPVLMTATLSGNNERPAAAATPATGSGTFALVRDRLSMAVTYQGLLSAATASHIHGPAGLTGSASVLVPLDPFNGGSYGTTGSLGGTVQLPFSTLLNVIDGQTYVNFHTTNYTGGEIRGHIMR